MTDESPAILRFPLIVGSFSRSRVIGNIKVLAFNLELAMDMEILKWGLLESTYGIRVVGPSDKVMEFKKCVEQLNKKEKK